MKKWMQKHKDSWFEREKTAQEEEKRPSEFEEFIMETLEAFENRPLNHFCSYNIIFEDQ